MTQRRIEAVFFDLGETLLTFGKLDKNKFIAEAMRRSYDYLKALNQPVGPFWAYRLKHLWGVRFHALKSSITGNDFDSLELIKHYGRRNGFDLTEDQWQQLNWTWYEPLSEVGQVEPKIVETLNQLRQMDLKVGLLSNTFVHASSLERHMRSAGFLDCLTPRLYTYQYPWRKPDSRIFQAAAEQIGVPCERIVYVGDRIDNDVMGSLKVGMLPVLKTAYTNKGKTPPEGTPVINTISELPELIERIGGLKKKQMNTHAPQPVCSN